MGDVVNLNRFRKQRERSSTSQRGAESRVRAGRAKAERQAARAEATRAEAALDGKRIERDARDDGDRTPRE